MGTFGSRNSAFQIEIFKDLQIVSVETFFPKFLQTNLVLNKILSLDKLV